MAVRKGWIVALLVVFVLAGLGLVGLGLMLSGRTVRVHPASTLVIDFADEVIEDPPVGTESRLFYRDSPTLWDHLRALDAAERDPNIEAVLLRIDGVDMGWAKAEELRSKLLEVQEHGRKVVAFIEGGSDLDYALASAADEIYMAPNTDLYLDGLASYETFFKGTLDKLGVRADLEHIGEYKSASEPWTRVALSDAAREAANALLDRSYAHLLHAIMESRGLDSATAAGIVDRGPYTSRQALAAGLVDSLVYPDELPDLLPGADGGSQIQLDDYLETLPRGGWRDDPKIAIVHATGTIVGGRSGTDPVWGRTIGAQSFTEALEAAVDQPGVRAIVVRIDSPGGEIYASHLMWRALRKASDRVPVVASFSDLAASGGYYMAMGADTLLADETSLTGSIGVVGGKFNVRGLYDKLGVSFDVLSRGQNAQFMSSLRDFTPSERERYVNDMFDEYQTFVGIVADNRGASEEEIDRLARGRVWTGGEAYENGLVDTLGGLEQAIATARVMAGLPADQRVRVEVYPRVKRTFLQEFLNRVLAEENLNEAAAHAGLASGLRDAWLRRPAELFAGLARLRSGRPLALMPFRIEVR